MSWRPHNDGVNSEEDDGDDYDYKEFSGREGIIFLIDAFLSKKPERFQECLDIIKESLLNGIFIKEKDLIGIVFYNTEHSPDPKDIEGIKDIVVQKNTAVLLPLRVLTKDIVSYYLDFAASETDHFDFNNKYGCTIGSLAKSIWLCVNMFKQCGVKLMTSTIIMFTDEDNPPDVEKSGYQLNISKASYLKMVNIDFNVIPMKDDFDYEIFFKEFICTVRDIELDDFVRPDPKEERELVSERQLRQNFKKQCKCRLRWSLNDGLEISVAIYDYYRKNIQPKSVKLLRDDNSIVDVKYVFKIASVDDEEESDERNCMPGDERKVITIGGEKITFTSDELAKMRSPLTPRLTLLGFKPRNIISIHNFIRSSSFLYPDEKAIEGSTKLFRTLWEKCIEKEKVAICVLVSRRKTPPRYVALVPTKSSLPSTEDPIHLSLQKDGFKIIYLPFEIDYRDIDLNEWQLPNDITESNIELFEEVIKKLKLKDFTPIKFHDPSLQKLRSDIKELALDLQPEDEIVDTTIDVKVQDSRIEPFLNDLENTFGEDREEAKKRRADGGDGAKQDKEKVPKISEENVSEEQVLQLIATKKLNQLTVKQLRSYLQGKSVTGISSATKPVLIDKVLKFHS